MNQGTTSKTERVFVVIQTTHTRFKDLSSTQPRILCFKYHKNQKKLKKIKKNTHTQISIK